MTKDNDPFSDVATITDQTCDLWERAREEHAAWRREGDRLRRNIQIAEGRIRRELGKAVIGLRESTGRVVVKVETQAIEEKTIEAHTRSDLRPVAGQER